MRARAGAVVVVALLVALTGCGSDDEPSAEATEDTSASTTTDPSETSTEPEPTESASVAPATGPLIDASVMMTYRLPDGIAWDLGRRGLAASYQDGFEEYSIFQFEFETTTPSGLDVLARRALKSAEDTGQWSRLNRVDNRTVNGVDGYVIEGGGKHPGLGFDKYYKDDLYFEFGAVTPSGWMYLQFEMPKDNAKYRGWIDSVLASIEWK